MFYEKTRLINRKLKSKDKIMMNGDVQNEQKFLNVLPTVPFFGQ